MFSDMHYLVAYSEPVETISIEPSNLMCVDANGRAEKCIDWLKQFNNTTITIKLNQFHKPPTKVTFGKTKVKIISATTRLVTIEVPRDINANSDIIIANATESVTFKNRSEKSASNTRRELPQEADSNSYLNLEKLMGSNLDNRQ
jgi:hypothetical protein